MTASKKIILLTATALTAFSFSHIEDSHQVFAHTHEVLTTEQGGFTFTATVLGENGQILVDKEVSLHPISGEGEVVSARTTDLGVASFSQLALNTNYSVSVEGVEQGYTIRSGVANEALTARFTLPEAGDGLPTYSTKTILLKVVDEEAEPLVGQTVELKEASGQMVASLVTGGDGQVSFSERLIDGTLYSVFVNGNAKTTLLPGQERVVFLHNHEIVTSTVQPPVSDDLDVKRAYVAKGAGVSLDEVTIIDTPQGQALMYPHGDHKHVILLADIDVNKPFDDGHDHHHDHDHDSSELKGGFTFVATVIDQSGKALSNRQVTVVDITTGEGNLVATTTTDAKGQAVLADLPLLRNLSILVDDVPQGHTVRTSENGDRRFGTFIVDGDGLGQPDESKQPLIVVVRDEEAVGVPDQTVALTDKTGRVIAETKTGKDGRAVFDTGLLDGLFYHVVVNGKALAQAFTGQTISVALEQDAIVKPEITQTPPSGKQKETGPETRPTLEHTQEKQVTSENNKSKEKQDAIVKPKITQTPPSGKQKETRPETRPTFEPTQEKQVTNENNKSKEKIERKEPGQSLSEGKKAPSSQQVPQSNLSKSQTTSKKTLPNTGDAEELSIFSWFLALLAMLLPVRKMRRRQLSNR